jgi:hypothetical protein
MDGSGVRTPQPALGQRIVKRATHIAAGKEEQLETIREFFLSKV